MILAIIIFILILSLLIFVHELGHFIFAKATGVKVEEFCIGFPPRLWQKKKGETVYSIGLIPFGGFNKIYGEIENQDRNDPRNFVSRPVSTRALITAGGVAMNVLLAVIIFYFILSFSGFQSFQSLIFDYQFPFGQQENFIIIGDVADNSPAKEADIEKGDLVLKVNGQEIKETKEFSDFIKNNQGKEINLKLENLFTEQAKDVNVLLRLNPPEGEESLGVAFGRVAKVNYNGLTGKAGSGFLHSFNIMHYSFFGLAYFIDLSLQEKDITPLKSSVAGPIGILGLIQPVVEAGLVPILSLIAIISIALALFNILPIPGLDGGKLLFLTIEAITRRPIPQKVEERITAFFFALLILLMILVTINDVQRFFS